MRVACHAVDNVHVCMQRRQQPPCASALPGEEQLDHLGKASRHCK